MTVDRILEDAEFGHIYVRINSRAVRYTYRPANDGTEQCGVLVTVPPVYKIDHLSRSFQEMRPRLRQMLERHKAKFPHPQTPEQVARQHEQLRQWYETACRELPARLQVLASQHGYRYDAVRISKARGRWGSCSSHRQGLFGRKRYTISLSFFLMKLPEHLQRHVMLHELVHTHHMDHSPAFHAELDHLLGGREKENEKELKTYSASV